MPVSVRGDHIHQKLRDPVLIQIQGGEIVGLGFVPAVCVCDIGIHQEGVVRLDRFLIGSGPSANFNRAGKLHPCISGRDLSGSCPFCPDNAGGGNRSDPAF